MYSEPSKAPKSSIAVPERSPFSRLLQDNADLACYDILKEVIYQSCK